MPAGLRRRVDVGSVDTNSAEHGPAEPGQPGIRLRVPNRNGLSATFGLVTARAASVSESFNPITLTSNGSIQGRSLPQDAVNKTVGRRRPLLVHRWGRQVQKPFPLVGRLRPERDSNIEPIRASASMSRLPLSVCSLTTASLSMGVLHVRRRRWLRKAPPPRFCRSGDTVSPPTSPAPAPSWSTGPGPHPWRSCASPSSFSRPTSFSTECV